VRTNRPAERGAVESQAWFTTTHWSVVLAAGQTASDAATNALNQLCQIYWPPIHAYIRRLGYNPADAGDLTQQFFARFIEKEHYRLANPQRGKFRTFLLTSLKNFLINEWGRATAQKRGGGRAIVSLEERQEEGGLQEIPVNEQTAEHIYEHAWAISLLSRVRRRLESEFAAEGKAERFACLEKFLPGEESDLTYAHAAAILRISEGTVKSDVHRLKRRYREALREEIAHTVASPAEVDEELRHLLLILSRGSG
jgi:RNA polymerase sigma factor (sigma-70 family)